MDKGKANQSARYKGAWHGHQGMNQWDVFMVDTKWSNEDM